MNRTWICFGVLLMALAMVVACGKPPQEDMDSAKAVLEEARTAQADKYASAEFQAAEGSMNDAQAEMDAQSQKWIKNYDKTKELLAKAKQDAETAKSAAATNKEAAKQAATTAIADATTSLDAAKAALKGAPVGKDTKADLALFSQDLDGLATTLTEAQTAMGSEDYNGAKDKASSVKEKADSIKQQIDEAAAKRAGAKKKK
jgi:colicin import membrane protein